MSEFSIIEQLNPKQVGQLHALFQQMWWSEGRTIEEIVIILKNCIPFGVIENERKNLIGFARVLTDEIKYAFIFDVMVVEHHQKKGLGKLLMNTIIAHPKLRNIKNFELTCAPDMVEFYEQFNFSKSYGDVVPMRCSISEKIKDQLNLI